MITGRYTLGVTDLARLGSGLKDPFRGRTEPYRASGFERFEVINSCEGQDLTATHWGLARPSPKRVRPSPKRVRPLKGSGLSISEPMRLEMDLTDLFVRRDWHFGKIGGCENSMESGP